MICLRAGRWQHTWGAIHSTKLSGNFGPKLNGSVRSNRKSFEKTGPPFEVVLFSRSDRLEFLLNGSRPWTRTDDSTEGKWKIMFFSFDYVIKEMVNVAAVQPWSYGCTWEVC